MDTNKKKFRTPNKGGGSRRGFKGIGFVALLLLFGLIIIAANGQPTAMRNVPLTQVIDEANKGKYSKIEVNGNELKVTKKGDDAPTLRSFKDSTVSLKQEGVDYNKLEVSVKPSSSTGSTVANVGLSLLPVLIISLVLFFMLRSAQGQGNQALSFGKSRARLYGNEKDKVIFKDIAGSDEAKQDLEEVVEFLKYPKKFMNLGARIPKGVLLVGPPGTGGVRGNVCRGWGESRS
jgi:cell division protease FtsH